MNRRVACSRRLASRCTYGSTGHLRTHVVMESRSGETQPFGERSRSAGTEVRGRLPAGLAAQIEGDPEASFGSAIDQEPLSESLRSPVCRRWGSGADHGAMQRAEHRFRGDDPGSTRGGPIRFRHVRTTGSGRSDEVGPQAATAGRADCLHLRGGAEATPAGSLNSTTSRNSEPLHL